jgi:hypothetical protein
MLEPDFDPLPTVRSDLTMRLLVAVPRLACALVSIA